MARNLGLFLRGFILRIPLVRISLSATRSLDLPSSSEKKKKKIENDKKPICVFIFLSISHLSIKDGHSYICISSLPYSRLNRWRVPLGWKASCISLFDLSLIASKFSLIWLPMPY